MFHNNCIMFGLVCLPLQNFTSSLACELNKVASHSVVFPRLRTFTLFCPEEFVMIINLCSSSLVCDFCGASRFLLRYFIHITVILSSCGACVN